MDVTGLLQAANDGDKKALEELVPLVYEELRWLARRQLRKEFGPRTLSTTALVHEAYLKLVNAPQLPAQNRRHFYAAAAQAMRHIMISEARRRGAVKRGDGVAPLTLESQNVSVDEVSEELLLLDRALDRLEAVDERLARIVEYRFFAGLTIEETAEAIDVSPRTVKRDWRLAKAWLFREMQAGPPAPQAA
jgi:RNA polymerase sigma factor (TIGR02999 family)